MPWPPWRGGADHEASGTKRHADDEGGLGKWFKKCRKLAKMVINDRWIEAEIYATMCSSKNLDEDAATDMTYVDNVVQKVSENPQCGQTELI